MQAADLLRLPFSRDLTEGGIASATRSLARSTMHRGDSAYTHLRQAVTDAAVELSLRRHLTELKIPFSVKTPTAFADSERYDVHLGGHRCTLNSFFISKRSQIREILTNPDILLDAPALIPLDEEAGEEHRDGDIYLFAIATGLIAASPTDMDKARNAGLPMHLVHVLPRSWATPGKWIPPGILTLKSEADIPLTVDLCGQTEDREIITSRLVLTPHARIESPHPYFSISSIHAESLPGGRLGIHAPMKEDTYIIPPQAWNNIWIHGMDIYLAGWISRAEYRKHATLIQPDTRVFQFDRTRLKNLALPMRDLHPMAELLEKAEAWKKRN